MRELRTKLILLLDASGSMMASRGAVIDGVNTLLAEQTQLAGPALVTVVCFNERLTVPLRDAPLDVALPPARLTATDYQPLGGTALLDALGGTVLGLGHHLARLPWEARPERVILAVLSDGRSTLAGRHSLERVCHLVHHQRHKYGWHFLFAGGGGVPETPRTVARMGFPGAGIAPFTLDAAGSEAALRWLSREIAQRRSALPIA